MFVSFAGQLMTNRYEKELRVSTKCYWRLLIPEVVQDGGEKQPELVDLEMWGNPDEIPNYPKGTMVIGAGHLYGRKYQDRFYWHIKAFYLLDASKPLSDEELEFLYDKSLLAVDAPF